MMSVVLIQHQIQSNVIILVNVIKHVLIIHQLVSIIDGAVLKITNMTEVKYVLEKNMKQILVLGHQDYKIKFLLNSSNFSKN